MSVLTATEAAEVDRFINSRENREWERKTLARWGIDPQAVHEYVTGKAARRKTRRHIASVARHASRLLRTPEWADQDAIRAIYAEARRISKATGIPHHVDHVIPLHGKRVSGLHVHQNLQILTGSDNCKKRNRFEIEP